MSEEFEKFTLSKEVDQALFMKDDFLGDDQSKLSEKINTIKKKLALHAATGKDKFNERLRVFKNLGSFIAGGFDIERATKESVLNRKRADQAKKGHSEKKGVLGKVAELKLPADQTPKGLVEENEEELALYQDNKLLDHVLQFLEEYNNEGGYGNEARVIDWNHDSFDPKTKFKPEFVLNPLLSKGKTGESSSSQKAGGLNRTKAQNDMEELKKFKKISRRIVEETKKQSRIAFGIASKEVMNRQSIDMTSELHSQRHLSKKSSFSQKSIIIEKAKKNSTLSHSNSRGLSPKTERSLNPSPQDGISQPLSGEKVQNPKKKHFSFQNQRFSEPLVGSPGLLNRRRRNAVAQVDHSTVVQALKILAGNRFGQKKILNKNIEDFYNYAMNEGKNEGGLLSALFDAVKEEEEEENLTGIQGENGRIEETDEDVDSVDSTPLRSEKGSKGMSHSNLISGDVVRLKPIDQNGKKILLKTRLSQRFRLPILNQIEKSKDSSSKITNPELRKKAAEIWVGLSQDANELPTQNSKQFQNYSDNLADLYQRMESNYQAYFVKKPSDAFENQAEVLTKTEMKVLQEISTYSFNKNKQFVLRKKHMHMI